MGERFNGIHNRSTLEKTGMGSPMTRNTTKFGKKTYIFQKKDSIGYDTGVTSAHDVISSKMDKYAYESPSKYSNSKIEMRT